MKIIRGTDIIGEPEEPNKMPSYTFEELVRADEMREEMEREEEPTPWRIENDSAAAWAIRKLKELEDEEDKIKNLAMLEKSRIEAWEEKETNKLKDSKTFFEEKLGEYLMELRAVNPKAKINTPYGTVTTRKLPQSYKYDDKVFLEWAKENHEEWVRVKEEINKAEVKKTVTILENEAVDENGEVVPGLTVIDQGEKLSIKYS